MRSRLGMVFIVPLVLVLLAGCSVKPAPTQAPPPAAPPTALPTAIVPELPTAPPPTAVPTAVPPTAATTAVPPTAAPAAPAASPQAAPGDDLARAEASGVLRVGTSLDNPPFSTYSDERKPAGLDIALITDLAQRLGFGVEIHDVEFENLLPDLASNQVDVAIAAISITPERSAEVGFTNAYYVGQDGVLAAPDSSVTEVRTLDDLAKLRVGVQEGTLYQNWLKANAVDAGKMPAENLVAYDVPDQGVLDLAAGNIDVFLLDRMPARSYAAQGRAKVVGEGIYPQVYGIAVRKGSNLLPELNRVLDDAKSDGTVAELVQKYVDVPAEQVLPATRQPSATPTP